MEEERYIEVGDRFYCTEQEADDIIDAWLLYIESRLQQKKAA